MPNRHEGCAKPATELEPIGSFSDQFHEANIALGAKAVAGLTGGNARTISGYGSDSSGTATCDNILRPVVAQARLGNAVVLEDMCASAGGAFVRTPGGALTVGRVLDGIARISKEFSDTNRALSEGMADGELKADERVLARKELQELIRAASELDAALASGKPVAS